MTNDSKEDDFSIENDKSPQVKDRETFVSSSGKQKIGLVGLVLVCFLVFYYMVFSGSDTDAQKDPEQTNKVEPERPVNDTSGLDIKNMYSVPEENDDRIVLPPELPKLPESPGIPDIPLPPKIAPPQVSPVAPTLPKLPSMAPKKQIEQPEKPGIYRQNRQTPMLVVSGGGVGVNKSAQVKSSGINITDPSQILDPSKLEDLKKSLQNGNVAATEDSELQRTGNQKLATRVGNLNYIIGEGKMIDAVLESAVNTDLKGKIRAIVSRDVYAESGGRVLVPKGSRLIGQYSSDISFTQARVDIFWTRIILPWGIDIQIDNFLGTDQLGRAGASGIVNNKFLNVMSTSVALAVIRVASGAIVDKVMGKDEVTINNSRKKGSSKSKKDSEIDDTDYKIKASPGAILAMQAVQDASKNVTDYINRYADTKPTIKINQGTRLKVFVNQDIVFPKSAFREYQVVN